MTVSGRRPPAHTRPMVPNREAVTPIAIWSCSPRDGRLPSSPCVSPILMTMMTPTRDQRQSPAASQRMLLPVRLRSTRRPPPLVPRISPASASYVACRGRDLSDERSSSTAVWRDHLFRQFNRPWTDERVDRRRPVERKRVRRCFVDAKWSIEHRVARVLNRAACGWSFCCRDTECCGG
jgi:hypothetical protein